MIKVYVTHPRNKLDHYFGSRARAAITAIADVEFNSEDRELDQQELIAAAKDHDFIIAYRQTTAPESLFAQLPNLSAFVRCAIDIRTVDVAAASKHGVLVTQASAGFSAAVSEWIVGAMIDLSRDISLTTAAYHAGREPHIRMGRELRGSTVGVIGYGQISRYFCGLALAFGCRVLVCDPHAKIEGSRLQQVDLSQLLHESDHVVCLAIANEQTENLMNAERFAAMKAGAFFINASRGNLVNDDALLAALDSGHLAGCAVDVGRAPDQMPTPKVALHPLVIASPHIGGLTPGAIEHQAMETVSQIATIMRGEIPVGAVNAAEAFRVRKFSTTPFAAH
jgi:D-3-phosphoglycerate dehydrogenase / 2-oxoglutarate reductase